MPFSAEAAKEQLPQHQTRAPTLPNELNSALTSVFFGRRLLKKIFPVCSKASEAAEPSLQKRLGRQSLPFVFHGRQTFPGKVGPLMWCWESTEGGRNRRALVAGLATAPVAYTAASTASSSWVPSRRALPTPAAPAPAIADSSALSRGTTASALPLRDAQELEAPLTLARPDPPLSDDTSLARQPAVASAPSATSSATPPAHAPGKLSVEDWGARIRANHHCLCLCLCPCLSGGGRTSTTQGPAHQDTTTLSPLLPLSFSQPLYKSL